MPVAAEMYGTGPNVIKEVTGEEITSHDLGSARQQELNGNVSVVVPSEDNANKALAFETVLKLEGQNWNISNPELVTSK